MAPGPLCQRLIDLCREAVPDAASDSPVGRVIDALSEPLRVAVAGRVSSGKSTIVNAIVGQRVGATAVGECTRIVTRYHYGAHEHAVVTRRDGTLRQLQLQPDGSLPPSLDEDPAAVARIDVWLSSAALEGVTVIDTPGLASLTGADETTQDLLALDADSRTAISDAEALLFVMSGEVHQDDVSVLDAFRELSSGLRSSTVNAIGLLNKVDLIGGGAPNAIELGQERAGRLAVTLRSSVATVVAVVGLMAETAETGALSDAHIRALTSLAALDEVERDLLLLTTDRFATAPSDIPMPLRRELLGRLDITGVRHAVSLLAQGLDVSVVLTQLRDRSGIAAVRRALDESFVRRADALKAEWGVATLERLSGSSFPPALAGRLEETTVDPAMHPLQELRAQQTATAEEVALPEELAEDLARLVSRQTLRERLGVPAAASLTECTEAAAAGSRRWAEFGNSGQAGPTVRRIAAIVRRSYDLMWQEASLQEAAS